MNLKYRNGLERFYDRFPDYKLKEFKPKNWDDIELGIGAILIKEESISVLQLETKTK